MPGIDKDLEFYPLNIAVLTISDTRDVTSDTSGELLMERAQAAGHTISRREIVKDQVDAIRAVISRFVSDTEVDIVLSTGGTGFSPRDVTPEAVLPLLDRVMDGFSAVFHQVSLQTVGVSTLQSRAFAGQAGETFVFCIPGSTGACRDAWEHILAFELDSRFRPCSLVGQIERYRGMCP